MAIPFFYIIFIGPDLLEPRVCVPVTPTGLQPITPLVPNIDSSIDTTVKTGTEAGNYHHPTQKGSELH
jgi:hypothetical protein